MRVASGCGCKKIYRFSHITYSYSSYNCSFLLQHPYFCSFLIIKILTESKDEFAKNNRQKRNKDYKVKKYIYHPLITFTGPTN